MRHTRKALQNMTGNTDYKLPCKSYMPTLQCTHHSSCRSGPRPGTPLGPPEPSPSAGPRVRWCRPHTGSGSCSSSASPQFSWSPSAHRSRQSSRRWGSLGGPGHYPTGSYCLWEGGSVKRWNIMEAKKSLFRPIGVSTKWVISYTFFLLYLQISWCATNT